MNHPADGPALPRWTPQERTRCILLIGAMEIHRVSDGQGLEAALRDERLFHALSLYLERDGDRRLFGLDVRQGELFPEFL